MKAILALVVILGFSSCTKIVNPKLFNIKPNSKPLPSRAIEFDVINANTNITTVVKSVLIPIREARWITAKLNRCERNDKIYSIANKALNSQIDIMNKDYNYD